MRRTVRDFWWMGGAPARSPLEMAQAGIFATSDFIWWAAADQVGSSGNMATLANRGAGTFNLTPQASFEPQIFVDSYGKKWLRFNESRANFVLTNFSTIARDYYVIVVYKSKQTSIPVAEIGNLITNPSGNRLIIQIPPGVGSALETEYALFIGATSPAAFAPTGPVPDMVHTVAVDFSSNPRLYVNNNLENTSATAYTQSSYGPTSGAVGSSTVSGVDAIKADISDIFILRGTYTDAIKEELRRYFKVNGQPSFAFSKNSFTDVNVDEEVIQTVSGVNFDFVGFGSFCIRRSNGKYYRVMCLSTGHNNDNEQIVVLQTSTDKGVTWSEFIPIVTGIGSIETPYTYLSSSSSVLIGTGAKTFTIETGQTIANGQQLMIAKSDDFGQKLNGTVTSYNSGTGELVMNITTVAGSGTYASWKVWKVNEDNSTITRTTPSGVFVNSNGRIFFGYNRNRGTAGAGDWDTRMLYSDDDGLTLTKITGDGEAGLFTNDYPTPGQCTGPDKLVEYNGSLYKMFYARTAASGDREIVIYKSDDGLDGQTYTKLATPQAAISQDYEEPKLLHLGQGVFRTLMRSDTQATTRSLWSWDGGVTWTTVRQDQFASIGYSGGVVTPSGGVVCFGRYASGANQYDTMLNYSNRYGQQASYTTKKANAENYYNSYGELDWDYDLNQAAGCYWEELAPTQGNGPSRIVFVTLQEV